MTAPALRMHGITKFLGGRKVLNGIDLDVAPGETVALLGANGAGKSTLLRIAATVSTPDAGSIHVTGLAVRDEPHKARAHVGFLAQDPGLYDELTPAEHLAFWAKLRGAPIDASASAAEAGLAAAAHRPCAMLSRGQRQRLALAVAALGAPPLLILDEPFTALDADGQRGLEALLGAGSAQARLVALHDEAQARRLADRIVRLEHHRLVPP